MSIEGKSDGSSADYYKLPPKATQLQDLISHRDMNAQIGEIFRACYRYGLASHSDKLRDAKKMMFYAAAEIDRLEALREMLSNPNTSEPEFKTGFCSHGVTNWKDCPHCNPQMTAPEVYPSCVHGVPSNEGCRTCAGEY